MPYDLHIIKTGDFIRFDGHGNVAISKSHEVLSGLAKACVERGIDCALLDVRDIHGAVPLADLYRLAMAFPEMGFQKRHRLAILHRYGPAEGAELFAMLVGNHGWNVWVFDQFEEAMEWFSHRQPLT